MAQLSLIFSSVASSSRIKHKQMPTKHVVRQRVFNIGTKGIVGNVCKKFRRWTVPELANLNKIYFHPGVSKTRVRVRPRVRVRVRIRIQKVS